MSQENVNRSPSKEVRDARVRLAKEHLRETLLNTVITIGVVALVTALAPALWAAFPAFAGLIKGVSAITLVGGGLFVVLNLLIATQSIGVVATGGRYYPGYIRIAGDDTKEEDLVEAHGVRDSDE